MRIATWNVERLKHKKDLTDILKAIESVQADILVLTETDDRIKPKYRYGLHTPKLQAADTSHYLPGRCRKYTFAEYYGVTENRVSIYTNFPCVRQHETYDIYTALCVELKTPWGNLLVYGTIMGVIGNRDDSFKQDILCQTRDFNRLSKLGMLCICGDFNCSFADNYYFTHFGRDTLLESFAHNDISLLTENRTECIDHIALSEKFIHENTFQISEWNLDKSLSDHKGILVEILGVV